MGFSYLEKFTYLNTFVMELAQRCLDNGGPTVVRSGLCGYVILVVELVCHSGVINIICYSHRFKGAT